MGTFQKMMPWFAATLFTLVANQVTNEMSHIFGFVLRTKSSSLNEHLHKKAHKLWGISTNGTHSTVP